MTGSVPARGAALDVLPEKLRASDLDTLRADVRYSFQSGRPSSFRRHFSVDPRTGVVAQTAAVDREAGAERFDIVVKVGGDGIRGGGGRVKLGGSVASGVARFGASALSWHILRATWHTSW